MIYGMLINANIVPFGGGGGGGGGVFFSVGHSAQLSPLHSSLCTPNFTCFISLLLLSLTGLSKAEK